MRITEVEKTQADITADQEARIAADQEAREAQRQADLEQKRAEAERIHKNRGKSVSPPRDADLKGKGPEIGDGQSLAQDFIDWADDPKRRESTQAAWEKLYAPNREMRNRLNAVHAEVGGADNVIKDLAPVVELPKPKYRKAERFSKTVLNNPNSVLQFDVPGYRTGTVGKPGTIQEKWQQFKTQSVKEKAPPGDKYERMIKDIKKGYAKDGELTDTERSIAYATAWKLYNKRKGKKS